MTSSKQATAPDPFDLEANRLGSCPDLEVEKVLLTVPVRKPKRTEFIRVHSDPSYTYDTYIYERDTGMDKETWWVAPEVKHLLAGELRAVRIVTVIDKQDNVFLWPIKLPSDAGDNIRKMAASALNTAEEAKKVWVKLSWNKLIGSYEMFRAKGDLGEPQWPEKSFKELLGLAFQERLIDGPDHEVLRELAGEL